MFENTTTASIDAARAEIAELETQAESGKCDEPFTCIHRCSYFMADEINAARQKLWTLTTNKRQNADAEDRVADFNEGVWRYAIGEDDLVVDGVVYDGRFWVRDGEGGVQAREGYTHQESLRSDFRLDAEGNPEPLSGWDTYRAAQADQDAWLEEQTRLADLEDDRARTVAAENVGGYEIPVDPMDDLQCDSCQ